VSTQVADATVSSDYFSAPGLSNTGLKDLAVSPTRYWHKWLNPERPPDEPTPAMQFGSALHCAVLEPGEFDKRYACEVSAEDYPGCLVSMDDLRGWLRDHGITPKGTRKDDAISQVQGVDHNVPILEVIERQHFAANQGKTILSRDDWARVHRAAESLRSEPRIQAILADGQAEVAMFATDPDTGVLLKAKMDWVTPKLTMDVKTFSQQRGKSIDKSVTDAIWYERYHWQAYLYSTIRTLQPGADRGDGPMARSRAVPPFVLAFVESEEPHEVRIRELKPMTGGQINLFWERARIEVRGMIQVYAECMAHFGVEKPWRYAREIDPLEDEELPALAYS
jgi:hypothetical protein